MHYCTLLCNNPLPATLHLVLVRVLIAHCAYDNIAQYLIFHQKMVNTYP